MSQKDARPKLYFLELHGGYWRLRREGNRTGTMRSLDKQRLRHWGRERGWLVIEKDRPSEEPG